MFMILFSSVTECLLSFVANTTRKAQLMQSGTHDSCACLKAHCEQNLDHRFSAIDIKYL